jgi:hypothetical protein
MGRTPVTPPARQVAHGPGALTKHDTLLKIARLFSYAVVMASFFAGASRLTG